MYGAARETHAGNKMALPRSGKRYDTNWKAVERNIRMTVSRIWENNRPLLERVAYRPLTQQPCASTFLAMSTQYLFLSAIILLVCV